VRILAVSNAFPSASAEAGGIFAWREIAGLRALGIEVEPLHSGFRRRFRSSWREFHQQLRRLQPDLVHVYAGSIGALAVAAACPCPLVLTFGGPDLLGPARRDPWSERAVGHLAVACSQLAAPNADAIVLRSEPLRPLLLRPADRARAHVIPAGVDLALFRPLDRAQARREVGWSGNEPVVLFGGSRWRAIKRFDRAVAAVERLRRQGVPARLESCEAIEPDRMPLFLTAADCLLLTSQHEGSPNIVKEAAACGCPIVTVPVGDVAEILDGVAPGAIVPADPDALAAALAKTLQEGRRSNGPERIRARYALDATARRVARVYGEAMASWRAGRRRGWRRLRRALPGKAHAG
jgi:glycosyltransferase involved in cell wall biosynthesis